MLCATLPNRADAATFARAHDGWKCREISSLPATASADRKDFIEKIRTTLQKVRALTLLEQFKNRAEALHI
jgi:hypothetical protein